MVKRTGEVLFVNYHSCSYMEISTMHDELLALDTRLTSSQKKYIHYTSILNFLNHFQNIPDKTTKAKVVTLLNAYYVEIEKADFDIDRNAGFLLGKQYLVELGRLYSRHVGFKQELDIRSALLWGIMADSLLLLSGVLKKVFFIPISTIILLLWYWRLQRCRREGKLYGLFY